MNVSPQEQATLFILVPCGQTLHIHAMAARPLPRIRNVTPQPVNPVRYPSAMLDHSLCMPLRCLTQ